MKSSKSNVIFVMKVLMDPGPPPDYDTAVVIKRNNFFPNVQRSQPNKRRRIIFFLNACPFFFRLKQRARNNVNQRLLRKKHPK